MDYWFTSDTHFFHKNLLKYRQEFATVEEMNEKLIENYNRLVRPTDIVFHLGDFSFKINQTESILNRLNGQKHLVMGNHDYEYENKYRKMNKFNWIKSYHRLRINKEKIMLFHHPIARWDCAHYGSIHLHGHSHAQYKANGKILDVGVDSAKLILGDYRPFSLDEVMAYMSKVIQPVYESYGD